MIAPRHPGAAKATVATGLASGLASKVHLPSQHSLRRDLKQQQAQGAAGATAATAARET